MRRTLIELRPHVPPTRTPVRARAIRVGARAHAITNNRNGFDGNACRADSAGIRSGRRILAGRSSSYAGHETPASTIVQKLADQLSEIFALAPR